MTDYNQIQEVYFPGDKWVYFKIYCGPRIADDILTTAVKKLTEQLKRDGVIDLWFYMRYNDPEYHLRLRLHVKEIDLIGGVINLARTHLDYYISNQLVWKIQLDTYIREIDRYGLATMEASELVFYEDSMRCLDVLNNAKDDEAIFLEGIGFIDDFLNACNMTLEQKRSFTKKNMDSYLKEFNGDKYLFTQLSEKNKLLSKKVEERLNSPITNSSISEVHESESLSNMQKAISIVIDNIDDSIGSRERLLGSYIHMCQNRLFRDQQRLYELVSYHTLHRYYSKIYHKS